MRIRLALIFMAFLSNLLANECTCEMEEIIDENADAINIAISKYKDIVYKRHKFDKSRYEVFVTPTFYATKYEYRYYDKHPPYMQDVYAFDYYVIDKYDSTIYRFYWSLWYNGINPKEDWKITEKHNKFLFSEEQIEDSIFSAEIKFFLSFGPYNEYFIYKSTRLGMCVAGNRYNEVDDICDVWNDADYLAYGKGCKEMLICHLHTESVKKFIARMDSVMCKTSFDNTTGSMALKFKPCRRKKLTDKFLENLNVEHPVLIRHNEYDAFIDSIKPEYSFYIYGDKDFSLFYVKNKKLRVLCHPDRGDKSVVKDFSYEAYYQTFVGKTRF